jgi:hypothetical protein
MKLRAGVIQNAACFLGLSQYNLTIQSKNMLDLVLANFTEVAISNSYIDLVDPDTFHPSLLIDLSIFFPSYSQSRRSFRNYAYGDYALLSTLLFWYDWSRVYRVDTAVTQLNAAVSEAMDQVIPYKYSSMSKYSCWFSSTLKYYISKNIFTFVVTKRPSLACIIHILHFIVS